MANPIWPPIGGRDVPHRAQQCARTRTSSNPYVVGRPVVGEIGIGLGTVPVFGMPENLEVRLAGLLDDPAMIELLVDRAEQSRMAEAAGAHLLALFGIGSLVGGMMLAILVHRDRHSSCATR
jgi:hypothetical protein